MSAVKVSADEVHHMSERVGELIGMARGMVEMIATHVLSGYNKSATETADAIVLILNEAEELADEACDGPFRAPVTQ